jgi:hypothetical protein
MSRDNDMPFSGAALAEACREWAQAEAWRPWLRAHAFLKARIGMDASMRWIVRASPWSRDFALALKTGAVVARAPIDNRTALLPEANQRLVFAHLVKWFGSRGKLIVDLSQGRAVVS